MRASGGSGVVCDELGTVIPPRAFWGARQEGARRPHEHGRSSGQLSRHATILSRMVASAAAIDRQA
jgi:hypothetical protein